MNRDEISAKPSRKRSGRPKKGETDRLEQSILEAAQAVFFAKGYASSTMGEIASLAQASMRTIYDRYPNKAALFTAAVTAFIADKFAVVEDLPLGNGALREDILLLARTLQNIVADEATLAAHRISVSERAFFPELIIDARRDGLERIKRLIYIVAESHGIPDKVLAADIFISVFVLAPLDDEVRRSGAIEDYVDFFIRGLSAGSGYPAEH